VENPSLVFSGYTQKPLYNDCAKFGKLKKLSGLSGFDFNADVDTSKYFGASETFEHLGKYSKFTFLFVAQPLTSTAPVRITLSARRYPTPTEFSLFNQTVAPVSNKISSVSHQVTVANKSDYNGGIAWVASRIGTHSEDTSTANLQCIGAEIEYYVGVI
ncbi:hypothetical protein OHV82_12420, partial [Acinetobacter baumannii]|nr:hypothetical protein [Acinetobacter baumannii]